MSDPVTEPKNGPTSAPGVPTSSDSPRPGELTIDVTPDGDALILLLRGELDLASVAVLDRALLAAQKSSARLIVDLSELSFIDSSGIHLLLRAQQRGDGSLSLRRGPPVVQRVLTLTKVADYLSFEDDLDGPTPRMQAASPPMPEQATGAA